MACNCHKPVCLLTKDRNHWTTKDIQYEMLMNIDSKNSGKDISPPSYAFLMTFVSVFLAQKLFLNDWLIGILDIALQLTPFCHSNSSNRNAETTLWKMSSWKTKKPDWMILSVLQRLVIFIKNLIQLLLYFDLIFFQNFRCWYDNWIFESFYFASSQQFRFIRWLSCPHKGCITTYTSVCIYLRSYYEAFTMSSIT